MIPEIIKNGINGFISNDESELRGYIEKLLYDEKLREELGRNARKTILDKFSEDKFIEKWNKTFDKIYEVKK
jgi:glycosyltransferase involved in cell wall biosynthesis